jgi:hypothetical protein
MTSKREYKIYLEGNRRLNLWLQNETFDDMTCYGSMLRFEMALGLYVYPFEKPKWMKKEKFNKFVTEDEFNNDKYNIIINILFVEASNINDKLKNQNNDLKKQN